MKPATFQYHAPRELQEALRLLAEHGPHMTVLAGGQSLVPMLNFRLAQPEALLDINQLMGLDQIGLDGSGGVVFGALVRQAAAERAPIVASRLPLLREALTWVGHPAVRSRGTLAGSAAHADPAAEIPAVLLVYDAFVRLATVSDRREVPASAFFWGPYLTAREPDELVLELVLPPWSSGSGWGFQELSRGDGDFALTGAAVLMEQGPPGVCRRCAVSLFGLSSRPLRLDAIERALTGEIVTPGLVRQVVGDHAPLVPGLPSTERSLAGAAAELVQRALLTAWDRGSPETRRSGKGAP